jgi:hypothetical protein
MDDDDIGYRKPPKRTRFAKGTSGNPRGRPRGARNLKTDLIEELENRIRVTEGGKRRTLTKQQALLKRIIAEALSGDHKAAALLLSLKTQYERADGVDPEGAPTSEEDRRILERYLERQKLKGKP